jgi:hypothetical protein
MNGEQASVRTTKPRTGEEFARAGVEALAGAVPRLSGCVMRKLRMHDTLGYFLLDLDEVELERRRGVGLGTVNGYGAFRLLCSLPLGEPVPRAELPDYELRLARKMPDGAITVDRKHVTRRMRPPLSVRLAVVVDREWDRGLNRAGQFSNFATRMLVCPTENVSADAWLKADSYGIGMVAITSSGERCVVAAPEIEPDPGPDEPITWGFQEEALAQLGQEWAPWHP